MASQTAKTDSTTQGSLERSPSQRLTTETKLGFKTTELIAYVVAVAGVLIATAVVDQADAGGLGARQGWLYVTILTVGYLISRGLAKSGSREPHTEHGAH